MATINGSTNNPNWTYKLEAYETSYSIENNTSVVRVDVYLGRAYSQSYLGGSWSGSVTVNGSSQTMSGTIPYPTYINGGEWLYLTTKDFTVSHNSDGTKTTGVSSAFSSSEFTPSSASASGSLVLTTIPRASTITATSAYIGETSQLTVNRKSDLFIHSIAYSFGTLSGYILADGTTTSTETKITATSIGFPLPSSWYAEIPSASEGTCTLTIKTYSGNTQIGSSQTSSFVARVNESTNKPTVTATVVDTNSTTIALTGNNNYLVKGYSQANITWNATAKNSATISNVKINDTIVTSSPYSFTLNASSINVVATDSRTLSTTVSPTFTLKDYFIPNVTTNGYRVAPTSNYAKIKFAGTFWNKNFGAEDNSLSISWKYREVGQSTWTTGGTFTENTDYKISNNNFYSGTGSSASDIQIGGSLVYAKAWQIGIFINDELYTMPTQIITITKGQPIFWWDDDGVYINGDFKINNTNIQSLNYPVGSIIIRDDNTDYSNWLGFTWQKIFNGKVLIGQDTSDTDFDTIGNTGGSKEVTLELNQIPSHTHVATTRTTSYGTGSQDAWRCMSFVGTNSDYEQTINTGSAGGGQAHSNLQPYQVVAYWKRIS